MRSDELSPDERELIVTLIAAQQAMENGFPRGALTAVARDDHEGRRATARAVWEGDKYYCDADCEELRRDVAGKTIVTRSKRIMIETPERSDYYMPKPEGKGGLLQRVTDRRMQNYGILYLRPRDCWFSFGRGVTETWVGMLTRCLSPDLDNEITVTVDGQAVVTVESYYPKLNDRFIFHYSLAQGGNMLDYHSEPGDQNPVKMRSRWEWEPVPPDRWRLRSYVHQMIAKEKDFESEPALSIEITDFDPDPVIPANRFDVSSLNLQPGTLVEELGANERRYRIGDNGKEESGVSEATFRSLVQEVREGRLVDKN